MNETDRFWAKVNKTDSCWLWMGSKAGDRRNYGSLYWRGTNRRAHRVAYELEYGSIPDGLYVCHQCDTPECVRPTHLFLATQKRNIQDMITKGRKASQAGEYGSQSKLTLADVRAIRSSSDRQQDIARRFHISQQQVSGIKTGRYWKVAAMESEQKEAL